MSIIITPPGSDELIKKPAIIPAAIQRLSTADGKGTAAPHIRIGDTFRVNIPSLRDGHITLTNGEQFHTPIIDIVDEVGRPLGWMYAELFFIVE